MGRLPQTYCKNGHLMAETRAFNATTGKPYCSICRQKYKEDYSIDPATERVRRNGQYKIKFGITLDEYEQILLRQENKCAICKSVMSSTNFAVDHNHKTGVVRGLLCNYCNRGLGFFNDNLVNLTNAISYIHNNQVIISTKLASEPEGRSLW